MTRPRGYEYPDGGVLSIDGRLRYEVRTAGPRRRWRLLDVGVPAPYRDDPGDDELWSRSEPAVHPWPWCLHVHVDGTTATLHGDDSLRLHDPGGAFVGAVAASAALHDDPRSRRHLARAASLSGSPWDPYPKACFVALRGRLCVTLRSYWGARVLVDARTAARVPEAAWMADDLCAAEEAWALARLLRAVRDDRELPQWTRYAGQDVRDVVAAVQLAGQLGLSGAAPLLQRLRHADPTGAPEPVPGDSPYRPAAGELDIRATATSRARRAVHLALLRLGRDPGPRPAYLFYPARDAWRGRPYDPGPRPASWIDDLLGARPGLQPRDLIARAGAPFHVRGASWDYDVVAGGPRTIRVTWGRRGVADARVVAPPEWIAGHARDSLA